MDHNATETHPKVRATQSIWALAIGMFGICVPLVAITESGLTLPIIVALSAGGGTAAVWLARDKRLQDETDLTQSLKALEERVINLETIYVSLPEVPKAFELSEQTVDSNLQAPKILDHGRERSTPGET